MTEAGWDLLVSAAPSHVSSVRRHLVDVLAPEEFAAAGAAGQKVADHILSGGDFDCAPECGVAPPGS